MSSATPVQARMANGSPTRRIQVAVTATESTSRVVRGRVFEDIHLLLSHRHCCVFHDLSLYNTLAHTKRCILRCVRFSLSCFVVGCRDAILTAPRLGSSRSIKTRSIPKPSKN